MATITSITMTRELVESILADYLNRNIFRSPVSVTGSEYIEESVILTLAECEPIVTTTDPITWTSSERFVTATAPQSNGNAHHADGDADLVGADLRVRPGPATTEEVAPAEAPKRRRISALTPELRAAILDRHARGLGPTAIAQELGVGMSTAARVIAAARQAKAAGVA